MAQDDDVKIPNELHHLPIMIRLHSGKILDVTPELCRVVALLRNQLIGRNSFSLCDKHEDAARIKERPINCESPEYFRYNGRMMCAHYLCRTFQYALILLCPNCERILACRKNPHHFASEDSQKAP